MGRTAVALPAVAVAGCERGVLAPRGVDAAAIATLSWAFFLVATFVFVVTLTLIALGLALGRRRSAEPPSQQWQWSLVIAGGVAAPFFAAVGVTAGSVSIGDETPPAPDARGGALIEVVGKRWWWEARYLDPDGTVLAITANEIHVPAGERTVVRLTSDNVNHSFWVPAVQGKTDLIPGRANTILLQPDRPGTYLGQCAEFCGIQHALMLVRVVAQERAAFDEWLARQAEPAAAADGLAVFMERGCGKCHTVRGTAADGQRGPDLTHLASRDTLAAGIIPNTRGNLGGWITDTQHVKPGALMPATRMPPQDLHILLDFLQALR